MKFTINVCGSKRQACQQASAQSDSNIREGNQTPEQKDAVLAAIEAATGTHVFGSISGESTGNANVTAQLQGNNPPEENNPPESPAPPAVEVPPARAGDAYAAHLAGDPDPVES